MIYRKTRRAKSKDDFETWTESEIANTLNTFDGGDTRATTVVVEVERADSIGVKSEPRNNYR